MPPQPPNTHVEFWQDRYDTGRMNWDLAAPSPHFTRLLEEQTLPPGKMAVLGAGRGHDASLFAKAGLEVTAFDYVEAAKAGAEALYGNLFRYEIGDIFYLDASFEGQFDYVLEHTCFCAIPVKRREEYVQTVRRLLKPGGKMIAVFWQHGDPDGPPFSTTPEELERLFGPYFAFNRLEPMPENAPRRDGQEYLGILTKRA